MNDILPDEISYWTYLENACRSLGDAYGYREIRFPFLEHTELFSRSIGEATDIVEKEMYTFTDRNGDSLTLRPEGTAGCVRAGIEHSLFYNAVQRLWYLGPMFRHERPQKGRYRQFYQWGVEAYGMSDPIIDVELILLSKRLWDHLQLSRNIELQINTLGTTECRMRYREELIDYLKKNFEKLDGDSQRRLYTNPLRVLDSKNPDMKKLIEDAPKLLDHLDESSRFYFDRFRNLLDEVGIQYHVNTSLVRGLDYYNQVVFEWVTHELGAQGTVCAGGRYDSLVERLGGRPTPAVGFAMGLERLVLLLKTVRECTRKVDVYFILAGEAAQVLGLTVAEHLREVFPKWSIEVNLDNSSFKSQFKRADKSGARWAVILGENELREGTFTIKPLREDGEQVRVKLDTLIAYLREQNDDE